jgi:hypothetical protein
MGLQKRASASKAMIVTNVMVLGMVVDSLSCYSFALRLKEPGIYSILIVFAQTLKLRRGTRKM